MYNLIKTKSVYFPEEKKHGIAMSDDCKDFISKCLAKDSKERLGTKDDINEILGHKWFADIDVNKLLNR